jgi:hypothetical protein
MEKKNHLVPVPKKHPKGVSHHLPHRTRYRLPKHKRDPKLAKKIKDKILEVPGVTDVDVNERTGSVLVTHEEKPGMIDSLGVALDAIAEDLFDEFLESEIGIFPGVSIFAHLLTKRAGEADQYVAGRTNNYFDLKTLVPMLFLGAGVIKVAQTKNWLGQVPAYVLFYYAFDSYIKLHNTQSLKTVEAIAEEGEETSNGSSKRSKAVTK